jgi:hypothetical protein
MAAAAKKAEEGVVFHQRGERPHLALAVRKLEVGSRVAYLKARSMLAVNCLKLGVGKIRVALPGEIEAQQHRHEQDADYHRARGIQPSFHVVVAFREPGAKGALIISVIDPLETMPSDRKSAAIYGTWGRKCPLLRIGSSSTSQSKVGGISAPE